MRVEGIFGLKCHTNSQIIKSNNSIWKVSTFQNNKNIFRQKELWIVLFNLSFKWMRNSSKHFRRTMKKWWFIDWFSFWQSNMYIYIYIMQLRSVIYKRLTSLPTKSMEMVLLYYLHASINRIYCFINFIFCLIRNLRWNIYYTCQGKF